ncbi:hypothetical protein AAA799B03_00972 [Marine Group I thaumarchaeote SCGC AAA799-B03]|uniref:Uncharacterized protein n=3 Tax=Marine Group I TaxID=905826 RepID=A0A087S6W9_9ARCH|nr:hypothetical protein AAA799N04_00829 [Marine Group I thaumarchaeote SCGC AAA799-N04]KFM19207.1 hypothetical protein SCCGRSA3_00792 [Marine Group I thaumarchaeote SCGC RSA3]KFM21473.1 hypothetical protein AAA799B03_00972 [Marine Group I thaumarchaeote SCGC AAA799-B03]
MKNWRRTLLSTSIIVKKKEERRKKNFSPREKQKILDIVDEYTRKGKSQFDIAEKINRSISQIKSYQDELVSVGRLHRDENGVLVERKNAKNSWVKLDKNEFLELPIISKWQEISQSNPKQFQKHLNKLLIICNTLSIDPIIFLKSENHLQTIKETLAKFQKSSELGTAVYSRKTNQIKLISYNEYASAVKNFVGCNGLYVPNKFDVGITSEKNDYSEIELTDSEWEHGLNFFKKITDKRFLALFAIQGEIFCRISALLQWKNNLEIRHDVINGTVVEYGYISKFYEQKQHAYYNKRIFDRGVLSIAKSLPLGTTIFESDEIRDAKKHYCQYLRKFYHLIGKIDDSRHVPNTDSWYYDTMPTHALRHSSTRKALRRTGGNYSVVATMGWASEGMVRQVYSKPDEELILRQNHCEYCKPNGESNKNKRFCGYDHYLLWQQSL